MSDVKVSLTCFSVRSDIRLQRAGAAHANTIQLQNINIADGRRHMSNISLADDHYIII